MWLYDMIKVLRKKASPAAEPVGRVVVKLPNPKMIGEEAAHRKRATELKKQKRFREAAAEMWLSFKALQKSGELPSMQNLYRYPKYLFLAGNYTECAVACEKMAVGKPFGNLDSGVYDCQRTRMFCSLAADAYEKMGNLEIAQHFRNRVADAGSDNQAFVDRQVQQLLEHGFTIAVVRDYDASEHPAYKKFKGKKFLLKEDVKRNLPLYSTIRDTGLFADDDNPVGIEYYDEVFDA